MRHITTYYDVYFLTFFYRRCILSQTDRQISRKSLKQELEHRKETFDLGPIRANSGPIRSWFRGSVWGRFRVNSRWILPLGANSWNKRTDEWTYEPNKSTQERTDGRKHGRMNRFLQQIFAERLHGRNKNVLQFLQNLLKKDEPFCALKATLFFMTELQF